MLTVIALSTARLAVVTARDIWPRTGQQEDDGLDNTASDDILSSGQIPLTAGLANGSGISQADPLLLVQGVGSAGPVGDVFIPSSGSEVF